LISIGTFLVDAMQFWPDKSEARFRNDCHDHPRKLQRM